MEFVGNSKSLQYHVISYIILGQENVPAFVNFLQILKEWRHMLIVPVEDLQQFRSTTPNILVLLFVKYAPSQ